MITIPADYAYPHSPAHEKDLVSAFLNYPERLEEYSHLTPEHFHLPQTRKAFELAYELRENHAGGLFDSTSFHELAASRGLMDVLGGTQGIIDLAQRPAFEAHMPKLVEKINEQYARRLAIKNSMELCRAAFEDESIDDVLQAASEPITAIHDAATANKQSADTERVIAECLVRYKQRADGLISPMGIRTIPEIDQYLRGLHGGRVGVIGAYSGGGKSVLSSQILLEVSEHKIPVAEINYEMKEVDSMDRKFIQASGIPSQAWSDPRAWGEIHQKPAPNEDHMRRIKRTKAWLSERKIRLIRPPNRQLQTLLSVIRKAVREMGAKVIAIDYLQLIRVRGLSGEQEVATVSHAIQEIAQELDIAILLLSQINENGDTKHGIVAVEDCDWFLLIEQNRDKQSEAYGEHYSILVVKDRHNGHSGKSINLILDYDKVRFVPGFRPKSGKGKEKKKVVDF